MIITLNLQLVDHLYILIHRMKFKNTCLKLSKLTFQSIGIQPNLFLFFLIINLLCCSKKV